MKVLKSLFTPFTLASSGRGLIGGGIACLMMMIFVENKAEKILAATILIFAGLICLEFAKPKG